MLEVVNKILGMFGKDIQAKATRKIANPGDQFSPFKIVDGYIGFKPFLIIENQNETMLYSHDCVAIDTRSEVELWILDQPVHMWKYAEECDDCHPAMTRFLVNKELLTWMELKWN